MAPILLVLFLVASTLPVVWPPPPGGSGRLAATIMLIALVIPVALHFRLVHWILHELCIAPSARNDLIARYARRRRLIGLTHIALSIISLALGWGWTVWDYCRIPWHGQPVLAPFAELLVPLPYLMGVCLAWIIHHDAERALHITSPTETHPFPNRLANFLDRFRFFALNVLAPLTLVVASLTLARFAPETADSPGMLAAVVLLAPLLMLTMPWIVKQVLGLRPLDGPRRDILAAAAARMNFRCSEILLWPKQGATANAFVLGLWPGPRYVVFTDYLLNNLDDDELEAVLGHEAGHVRHGHIVNYLVFLVLSFVLIFSATGLLAERIGPPAGAPEPLGLALLPFASLAAFIYFVFGWLSRHCERQADLYGVATVAAAATEGHPQARGVFAMTRALENVALLNGLENTYGQALPWRKRLRARLVAWQHGSIADRIGFLHSILQEPDREARAQQRIARVRWSLLLALVIALIGLAMLISPSKLSALL